MWVMVNVLSRCCSHVRDSLLVPSRPCSPLLITLELVCASSIPVTPRDLPLCAGRGGNALVLLDRAGGRGHSPTVAVSRDGR